MSDAENNNASSGDGSDGDASTQTSGAGRSREGSPASSSGEDDATSPSLSIPSPKPTSRRQSGANSTSSPFSTSKRSSLSERLRKLANKSKPSSKDDDDSEVGFVSSLTTTPPPQEQEQQHEESDAASMASESLSDGETAPVPDDSDDGDVAKTDRVTSLPFEVIVGAESAPDDEATDDETTDRIESPIASPHTKLDSEYDRFPDTAVDDSTDRTESPIADASPQFDTHTADNASTDRVPASVVDESIEQFAETTRTTDLKTDPSHTVPIGPSTDRMTSPGSEVSEYQSQPDPPTQTDQHDEGAQSQETTPAKASTRPGAPIFDTTRETLEPAVGVEAFSAPTPEDSPSSRPSTDSAPPPDVSTPPVSPKTPSVPSTTVRSPGGDDKSSTSDDENSEFDVQNTEVFQSAFDNDPISPRLSTLAGPAMGQDFLVNRMRNSFGRGTANSVSVPDPAMSRMHFEIVQNPDQTYLLKDMRAVNGTSLNGMAIKEADLFHGDRIEAGQSTFQFIIPGDAPVDDRQRHLVPAESTDTETAGDVNDIGEPSSPDSATSTRGLQRLLLIITIGSAVLSIPLLGFLLHATVLDDAATSEESTSASAHDLYFDGVEAFRDHDLERAEDLFRQSQKIDPDFELAETQLTRLDEERQAKALIKEARLRTDDELDDELVDQLRAIPRESRYYRDSQEKLDRLPHNEARLLFVDAQRAYDSGDRDESLELVEQIRSIEPEHEGAHQLEEAIAEQRELEEDSADDEQDEEETSGEAVAQPSQPSTPRPSPQRADKEESTSPLLDSPFSSEGDTDSQESDDDRPSSSINFMDGFNLYRAEQLPEAIDHFDAIVESSSGTIASRAERTADDIRDFDSSRQAGQEAFDAENYTEAAAHFEQALRADESVVSGGSFQDALTNQLAESLSRGGSEQLERGDYSSAYTTLERAENYRADHQQVSALRSEIDDAAQSLYQQATSKKESNPEEASSLFEAITTMVAPDHHLHQSAREHLEEL